MVLHRVLIVEDEEIIRLGLASTVDWLSMQCSVVGTAEDGDVGLKMIQELQPDIVIADIRMPGMNGMDMIDEGRKFANFRSILLTSYSEFEYAQRAVSIQTYEYMLKPLDEDKLRSVIARIQADIEKDRRLSQLEMLSGVAPLGTPATETVDAPKDPLVDTVLQRIIECSHEKLSIESLAKELYVSPSYLSRRFKAVTGRTFLDMLNMHRVQQAVKRLNEGSESISRIAEETGFGDYKHFCEVFKRYIGQSPRSYIKSRKSGVY